MDRMTATEVFAIQQEWATRNIDRWREFAIDYRALREVMAARVTELLRERGVDGQAPLKPTPARAEQQPERQPAEK